MRSLKSRLFAASTNSAETGAQFATLYVVDLQSNAARYQFRNTSQI